MELSDHLKGTGFKQSKADPCVFYKLKDGKLSVVSIYVDDLILAVDIINDLLRIKKELSVRFKMKDLGQLRYCLGLVVSHGDGWLSLQQKPYLENFKVQYD